MSEAGEDENGKGRGINVQTWTLTYKENSSINLRYTEI